MKFYQDYHGESPDNWQAKIHKKNAIAVGGSSTGQMSGKLAHLQRRIERMSKSLENKERQITGNNKDYLRARTLGKVLLTN